ncbi:MAG: hypothetical protein OEV10_11800 [Gammaproteobacteria bacterium]|jgi:hypothetical protein|nr:hypothetical protein [Gammaproteobacteria bacterium]MDH3983418.1 hypothetical protein [Gammaproteobacteria bacterium]
MKVRKSLAAIGAALMVTVLSVPASASDFECKDANGEYDKDLIAANLKIVAEDLRCKPEEDNPLNAGNWIGEPIWIKRGKVEDGCEVHSSLARKLHEFRDPANPKPPRNGEKNLAAGASNDVAFEKYGAALDKLGSFMDDIGKAKINESLPNVTWEKMKFYNQVEAAYACVQNLPQ